MAPTLGALISYISVTMYHPHFFIHDGCVRSTASAERSPLSWTAADTQGWGVCRKVAWGNSVVYLGANSDLCLVAELFYADPFVASIRVLIVPVPYC